MLFNRILAREARIDQQIGKLLRIDFGSGPDVQRGAEQPLGAADARQERGRGGDDQAAGPRGGAVQRARARRRDAKVRGHAAIRIDLERGQRQHGALDVGV